MHVTQLEEAGTCHNRKLNFIHTLRHGIETPFAALCILADAWDAWLGLYWNEMGEEQKEIAAAGQWKGSDSHDRRQCTEAISNSNVEGG